MKLTPVEGFLFVFAIFVLFLFLFLILWLIVSAKPIPFVPVGPTGSSPTGSTGSTGMTGISPVLKKAIAKDICIYSKTQPYNVLDITTVGHEITVLTVDQRIISNQTCIKLPFMVKRIVGFNGRLIVLDVQGRLWYLDIMNYNTIETTSTSNSSISDDVLPYSNYELSPVDNCHGRVIWLSTTIDQDYLWVTYAPLPGQEIAGELYNKKMKVKDSSDKTEYR